MITIDTTKETRYNPLISAIVAICLARKGDKLQVLVDDEAVFKDLKEYLSAQEIGFREIYDEDQMTLQFTI